MLLRPPVDPTVIKDAITLIRKPEEFESLAGDGGCSRACASRLPCGHACVRRCVRLLQRECAGVWRFYFFSRGLAHLFAVAQRGRRGNVERNERTRRRRDILTPAPSAKLNSYASAVGFPARVDEVSSFVFGKKSTLPSPGRKSGLWGRLLSRERAPDGADRRTSLPAPCEHPFRVAVCEVPLMGSVFRSG